MSKIRISDEYLYQCMPVLGEKLAGEYPKEEDMVHVFSDEFEQKMEKLKKRVRQKERYGVPITTVRRIAAAILIGLAASLAAAIHTEALTIERIKEKLYEMEQIVYDTYTESRFDVPGDKAGEFVPLYPTYVPEGYELTIDEGDEEYLTLSYENENGEGIIIGEDLIMDAMTVTDNNEFVREESAVIKGYEAHIGYRDSGSIEIRWKSDDTMYLVGADELSKEELLKVCESLEAK